MVQEAYRLTRKDGAPGIDGVTADDYAINLEADDRVEVRLTDITLRSGEPATRGSGQR